LLGKSNPVRFESKPQGQGESQRESKRPLPQPRLYALSVDFHSVQTSLTVILRKYRETKRVTSPYGMSLVLQGFQLPLRHISTQ
jgi:hypothetical protein